MAKRKRLSPAPGLEIGVGPAPETKALNGWVGVNVRPPIADVSRDAAAQAAFEEVAGELKSAREEGRLISALPLEAVDETHLVRDRINVDAEDMAALTESLRARGQKTPIEVVDLGQGRYGLISGWRRLMALRALHGETGEARFAQIQALIRTPETASDAYQAMVEENEIRADLSFYERARIAVQAARQGIYSDPKEAVQSLFAAARASKRSKILSFTTLVEELDDKLRFPASIPEKLGLAVVADLNKGPFTRRRYVEALRKAGPQTAERERAVLEQALRAKTAKAAPEKPTPEELAPGLVLRPGANAVRLSGPAVDEALLEDLRRWLVSRQKNARSSS